MIAALLALTATLGQVEESPIRYWVDDTNVRVGLPFWIHVEATGTKIELPATIRESGIVIDPINVRQSTFHARNTQSDIKTIRKSYSARVLRPGTLVLPPVEITVDNKLYTTKSLTLTALTIPTDDASEGAKSRKPLPAPKEELVFISMDVDRREVYQGEPVFFRTQLWRIMYQDVDSGPYRESRIELPTTEGFFVAEIDPLSFVGTHNEFTYDVWEERSLLYPIDVGDLMIGKWHWEGVALINRRRTTRRDRMYYDLDIGPIPIKVKAIPQGPPDYSGSVGEFSCDATMDVTRTMEGVPLRIDVTLYGEGNPFAMGEPHLPEVTWARINEIERETNSNFPEEQNTLEVTKVFAYDLVPLRSGSYELPAVTYTYFSPSAETFKTAQSQTFAIEVVRSGEAPSTLVAADDVPVAESTLQTLGNDIQPALLAREPLEPQRTWSLAGLAFALLPLLAYAGVVHRSQRRTPSDITESRRRARAAKTLRGAADQSNPVDAVYDALTDAMSAAFSFDASSIVSADLPDMLKRLGVASELAEQLVDAYSMCERGRYASEELSADELKKLLASADHCLTTLNELKRRR